MSHINVNNSCTGCSACMAACPKDAITMAQNRRGFYIPKIDLDLCVDCGACVKTCPLKDVVETDRNNCEAYYQFASDKMVRKNSTSGAAFYLMAKKVISDGGLVCGVVWGDNYVAKHVLTDQIEMVERMRGSKYVQSHMGNCFRDIKNALKEGRKVLFCGTGCQTTGLIKYVGDRYAANLVCVALICGGVPSPEVWEAYKEAIEEKAHSSISEINMRSKNNGWYVPEIYLRFRNGKVIQENLLQGNLYGTNFNEGLFINDDCMNCQFKFNTLQADLIIADHWGINKEMLADSENLGSSCIIVLSDRGQQAVESISDCSTIVEGSVQGIIDSHGVLTKNHKPNQYRDEFFANYDKKNILELFQKYYTIWEKSIGRSPIIPFLYKTGLYNKLYMLKWKITHK